MNEKIKRNVLCVLKKTLERNILGAPVNAFALLVKGTDIDRAASILLILH